MCHRSDQRTLKITIPLSFNILIFQTDLNPHINGQKMTAEKCIKMHMKTALCGSKMTAYLAKLEMSRMYISTVAFPAVGCPEVFHSQCSLLKYRGDVIEDPNDSSTSHFF